MELKLELNYPQILNLVRQLPVNQIAKLLVDAQSILEEEKKSENVGNSLAPHLRWSGLLKYSHK